MFRIDISKNNLIKAILWGLIQSIIFYNLYSATIEHIKVLIAKRDSDIVSVITPEKDDPGVTAPDRKIEKESHPDSVVTGTYLERIITFDMVQSKWTYEFYQWFKWNPKKVPFANLDLLQRGATLSAEKSPIKIINGDIERMEMIDYYLNETGDEAYLLLLIKAVNTQFFDATSFPMDKHLLLIPLEHINLDITKIRFIPDTAGSKVSSRVAVNGYIKGKTYATYKLHTYKSALGDPRASKKIKKTFAQYRFGLTIQREDYSFYSKMFITLFVAILIAFLSFFANESEKIRIIVGSLFTVAASFYVFSNKIPTTSATTIAESVNSLSIVTIFIIICQETIVKFFIKENKQLAKITQWITFLITLVFYILINIQIPYLAFN